MSLADGDRAFIRELVQRRASIILDGTKDYLFESRLVKLAHQEGCDTVEQLIARLRSEPFSHLRDRVVEAMLTTETLFFRDPPLFHALRTEVLPRLLTASHNGAPTTIWCAACSSGQEPYSIAMLIKEHFDDFPESAISIIGSDLSQRMIERARVGRYSALEVTRGLPPGYLSRFFEHDKGHWQLHGSVRRMVRFENIHLCEPWPMLPKMDVVFLRNVLIYFDIPTRQTILDKIGRIMKPGGLLFLGNGETTLGVDDGFLRIPLANAEGYRLRAHS